MQLRARADNFNSTWNGSLSVKKTAFMFQLLQNNLEISLSKKGAKNVLLGKSHLNLLLSSATKTYTLSSHWLGLTLHGLTLSFLLAALISR